MTKTKDEATTTLVRQHPGQLARPDFIEDGNDGLEEISLKDMILPRLGLCQTNSQARDKNHKKYIKGLEEGQMFNSLTGQIYGENIQVIPLFFYHSRIMFKDMKEGGGIICQAPDGKSCQMNHGGPCLHSAWGAGGEPPECSEFFNYPSLVYYGETPELAQRTMKDMVVVSLKTTGLNAGKTMNSLMRLRGTPAYAGIYKLSAVPAQGPAGSYYTWAAENGDPAFISLKELYTTAKSFSVNVREGIRSGSVKVDESDEAFANRDTEV